MSQSRSSYEIYQRQSRNGRIQESKNLVEVTLCFGIACHDLQGALYKLKSHGHETQSIITSKVLPPSIKVLWASRFMDALYLWDV